MNFKNSIGLSGISLQEFLFQWIFIGKELTLVANRDVQARRQFGIDLSEINTKDRRFSSREDHTWA